MTVSILPLPLMRIPVTIIHVMAMAATFLRISLRVRRKNWWLDDAFATLAVFLDLLYLITFWLRSDNAGKSPPNVLRLYIILHWFHLVLGTSILWLARISIMVGINRIVLPWGKLKKVAMTMPFLFLIFWLVVLSQKIWVCARTTTWHHARSVQCHLLQPVPSVEMALDLLADLTLFVIPARVLRDIHLAAATRRLVRAIFATSILTTLANIVYIAFMLGSMKWGTYMMVAVAAHIEATVSLTVCNLTVLMPAGYRVYQRWRGIETSQVAMSDECNLDDVTVHTSYWTLPRVLQNTEGTARTSDIKTMDSEL